ncbi:hypothetical protein [Neobacillus muris]|uniref:hypothetical protein n=1 Tax=Neobacillus muris TaxID=2941334 RepID=UPI00203D5A44|nr:hypothetical protein [Neobacillus muris]
MFTSNGGGIDVSNIKVNGKSADYDVNGTALHITGVSLKKAAQANVSMEFSAAVFCFFVPSQ